MCPFSDSAGGGLDRLRQCVAAALDRLSAHTGKRRSLSGGASMFPRIFERSALRLVQYRHTVRSSVKGMPEGKILRASGIEADLPGTNGSIMLDFRQPIGIAPAYRSSWAPAAQIGLWDLRCTHQRSGFAQYRPQNWSLHVEEESPVRFETRTRAKEAST